MFYVCVYFYYEVRNTHPKGRRPGSGSVDPDRQEGGGD